MAGGKRTGAGRPRKPDHLRREALTIRLPQWMIDQLRANGQINYFLESLLFKDGVLKPPPDYDLDE